MPFAVVSREWILAGMELGKNYLKGTDKVSPNDALAYAIYMSAVVQRYTLNVLQKRKVLSGSTT